jgi:hypothetical protein
VLYDDIMRIEMPQGVELICYADDLAVSTTAGTSTELMANTNAALHAVSLWMRRNMLEIAAQKTIAIMLRGDRKFKDIKVTIEGVVIKPSREATYLGVVLDPGLNFHKHIKYASEKAQKTARALSALMPNTMGPKHGKRKILALATQSILLYAAPIWESAIKNQISKNKLLEAQRVMSLRVCCAYRTVSTEASLVVSGLVPIHLMAAERERKYRLKIPRTTENDSREREETIKKWQREWEESDKGRWTYKLIRELKPWIDRRHGEITFHMTQCLTGHGVFNKFLHKIGKSTTPQCMYCNEEDDAEHTLFMCRKWADVRKRYLENLGRNSFPQVEELIKTAVRSKKEWNATCELMETIMRQKEKDETTAQREQN